ncbi:sugar phosphate isomerase/epimerase [candidate division KSB1 bacterium]|nr:sugar phosphate isomerase/epimerase [candidate division KSB1 bacterium]RQW09988.1 MAG: sugar phosphate isomerase/epimerase [candidate division KSB1 bacterium]
MYNRRLFLRNFLTAPALLSMACRSAWRSGRQLFKISLSEESLRRSLLAGQVDHLDLPRIAKELSIHAVEYGGEFFAGRAQDRGYLENMRKQCQDFSVKSLLIRCDGEGRLGEPDALLRKGAVEGHYKWVQAAQRLGCQAICVHAESDGSFLEQQQRVADGLRQLCDYAEDYKINVLVENRNGPSANAGWLIGVIKMVDHLRIGTLPDFGNFQLAADEWYDRYVGVAELMPFAGAVSAQTGEFDARGNDIRTDYLRMVRVVVAAGYRGHIGINYRGPREIWGIQATKTLLERVRTTLMAEADSSQGRHSLT